MTGGSSLGLRSSSYGSLQQYHQQYQQQQQQQQQQQMLLLQQKNVVAVQVVQSTPPLGGRKGSKMSLSGGSWEKEKFLIWVCRLAGRRKVGMFLLAIISLVVLSSILSAPGKDDDMSVVPERNWLPSHPYSGTQIVRHNHKMNTSLEFEMRQVHSVNRIQDPLPIFNLSMFPATHPCEHFSLPPPPSDKKRTGPRPCDVCYLPVEHAMAFMPISQSESPVLKHLTYFSEENSHLNATNGGSSFGGHPSLQQRNDSFHIQDSMTVHCGFFKGTRPGIGSGFDIDGMDLFEMEQCQNVVVASAIFGNYDVIQQPKNISELTKKHACFFMFVDEETEAYMKNSSTLDSTKKVGLWRVVVVRNLPYADARRNGKIPKLLLHRLFPNARYSLWIDGKLELVVDPYQILERFLWRKNATFAISRHYRRFDVFLEAEANKAAGKYDNASIDYQTEFYKNEGLTPYSEAKLPITSDVPEGCVIIREHLPISNLFTCLWFNEVDRFTSRDQISFSTVRDKIMSKVNWSIDMFLDCERRNFVIQAYHRDLLEQMKRSPPLLPPPLPPVVNSRPARKSLPETVSNKASRSPPKKPPAKRGRDRKSGSRHHRPKVVNNDRNNNPI